MSGFNEKPRELKAFAPALALLAACVFINYVDRGNLSIAAPLIKDELRSSNSQLGILLSAFFWSYTALQIVCGWLVDKFEVNWALAAGFLLWSLATAATGVAHGFAMLLVMRLLLGVGEAVAYPACSKILGAHLPEHQRGFANGILQAGQRLGPAVGAVGAGLLIATYGWRPVFIGMGVISLAWLPAWAKWMPRGTVARGSLSAAPGFTDILRHRSFWGVCAGQFSGGYLAYFMLTWLPFYLVRERRLSMQSMAKIAGAYYLADALSALATGWLSDFFIRRGYTPTRVRKSAMAVGQTLAAISLVACAIANSHWYLLSLAAVGVGSGVAGSGLFAFSQTLAGPQATGKWTGMQNAFGNLPGVVAPALTGFLVDRTGNFIAPLAITAMVLVLGAFSWMFVVGRLEPVGWKSEQRRTPLASSRI